ncbi:MAG: hypothetical protein ACD_86C00003G0007 [uncultured bacterium]|nr:MAG: hypothetical protein ACD_86C00003G0007 [uncultured bacterium]
MNKDRNSSFILFPFLYLYAKGSITAPNQWSELAIWLDLPQYKAYIGKAILPSLYQELFHCRMKGENSSDAYLFWETICLVSSLLRTDKEQNEFLEFLLRTGIEEENFRACKS